MERPPASTPEIVERLLPVGVSILSSRPKNGKSLVSLAVSVAVATGTHFCGMRTRQGDVLYVDADSASAVRFYARLQSLSTHVRELGMADELGHLHYTPIRLTVAQGLFRELRKWILSVEKPRLIVVDTWGAVRSHKRKGGDSYTQDLNLIKRFGALASEFGIAVLLVHHDAKTKSKSANGVDSMMGSTGLSATVDTILNITRRDDKRVLSVTGRDNADALYEFSFDLESGRVSLTPTTEDELTTDKGHQSVPRRIIEHFKVQQRQLSRADLIAALGRQASATAISASLTRLVQAGDLHRVGNGLYQHRELSSEQSAVM